LSHCIKSFSAAFDLSLFISEGGRAQRVPWSESPDCYRGHFPSALVSPTIEVPCSELPSTPAESPWPWRLSATSM
jgi:hypothetical protein